MLTAYSLVPSLPFVLLDRDALPSPPDSDGAGSAAAVIARLDLLHGLVEETRAEVLALRALNVRVLDLVVPGGRAEPAAPVVRPGAQGTVAGPTALTVSLLGAFEVRIGERVLDGWRSRKPRQLLAYLAMEPERPVARDTLIEAFWPESAPSRGANNLSIAVHHIRSRLGELLPDGGGENRGIHVQQGQYRLDPALRWEVDIVDFRAHVAAGRTALAAGDRDEARTQLGEAIERYRADLLESDLGEEWAIEPREALQGLLQWALSWLASDAGGAGDWPRVLQLGQQLVQRDACDEVGHRSLISAYAALGNRGQALRQYRACEEALRDDFGVAPSAETRALLRELRL